jgi:hypothetical protein
MPLVEKDFGQFKSADSKVTWSFRKCRVITKNSRPPTTQPTVGSFVCFKSDRSYSIPLLIAFNSSSHPRRPLVIPVDSTWIPSNRFDLSPLCGPTGLRCARRGQVHRAHKPGTHRRQERELCSAALVTESGGPTKRHDKVRFYYQKRPETSMSFPLLRRELSTASNLLQA